MKIENPKSHVHPENQCFILPGRKKMKKSSRNIWNIPFLYPIFAPSKTTTLFESMRK